MNIVIHGSTAVRGRGDLVAYRWALWKLTAPWTHRTRPPHLGKRCAFSTSSTGPFPSNHSRKTPKGPKIALGNPDRPPFFPHGIWDPTGLSWTCLEHRLKFVALPSGRSIAPQEARAGRSHPGWLGRLFPASHESGRRPGDLTREATASTLGTGPARLVGDCRLRSAAPALLAPVGATSLDKPSLDQATGRKSNSARPGAPPAALSGVSRTRNFGYIRVSQMA